MQKTLARALLLRLDLPPPSRLREEQTHKPESALFFRTSKISPRPLQASAEHKFCQVVTDALTPDRGSTPRERHPARSFKIQKTSHGTTPQPTPLVFWAPGVGAISWALFNHKRTHCRRAHRQQQERFPPRSLVHLLSILCTTTARETLATMHSRALAAQPFVTPRPRLAPSVET